MRLVADRNCLFSVGIGDNFLRFPAVLHTTLLAFRLFKDLSDHQVRSTSMQVKFASLLAILCLALSVVNAAEGDVTVITTNAGMGDWMYGNVYYDPNTRELFYVGLSSVRKYNFNTDSTTTIVADGTVHVRGIAADPTGSTHIIVAAPNDHCYKRIDRTTGAITNWLGTCGTSGTNLNTPLFSTPWNLVPDSQNQLWSTSDRTIIKIDPVTKVVTALSPRYGDEEIRNMQMDTATNTAYVLSHKRLFSFSEAAGTTHIAGPLPADWTGNNNVDGTNTSASFGDVWGLVFAPNGFLYVTGRNTGKHLRKVDPSNGAVTTLNSNINNYQLVMFYAADTNQLYLLGTNLAAIDAPLPVATPAPPPTPPTPAPFVCTGCATALSVDYTSDLIPDGAKDAVTSIALDESTWEVVFTVSNVRRITNGHVIAHKVITRDTAAVAFTPYVAAFNSSELWTSPECALGDMDTPHSNLGITAVRETNCTRTYTMIYSLVDTNKQNTQHCTLSTATDDLTVTCNLTLSSVRAYDLTEPTAFLSSETSFTATITLPRNLNNNVTDLLYATLAKCNVLNAPDFAIDCRVPGVWNFDSTFAVSQNIPDWINAASCASSSTAVATFVRCDLNSVPVSGYTEANANVTATVAGSNGQQLTFSLEYTLPRSASATASASLQNFIVAISMQNEKYYYAGADRATLLIETFDTSRLQITQLEFFNANSQAYNLRGYPQFQLTETSNATHFIIEFRPSAIRQDSAFYRNGPHGINVSFLFTAAGTRRHANAQEVGTVVVEGIRVRGDDDSNAAASNAGASTGASSASSSIVIIVAVAGVAVVAVGSIVAAVAVSKKRRAAAPADAPTKAQEPAEPHAAVEITDDQV